MTDNSKKAVLNRISRAMGHMEFVKRMIEEGRDPSDILVQLSAVKSAIHSTGLYMIEEEIDELTQDGNPEKLKSLLNAMERYCK